MSNLQELPSHLTLTFQQPNTSEQCPNVNPFPLASLLQPNSSGSPASTPQTVTTTSETSNDAQKQLLQQRLIDRIKVVDIVLSVPWSVCFFVRVYVCPCVCNVSVWKIFIFYILYGYINCNLSFWIDCWSQWAPTFNDWYWFVVFCYRTCCIRCTLCIVFVYSQLYSTSSLLHGL